MLAGYDPTIDPAKKTVGIPRSLMIYKFFPMAHAFFTHLGFNVLLSDTSSEATIARAQETAQGETCFPIKLMHGHMLELVERGVDYIFMPAVRTVRHEHSTLAHNYGCPYMYAAPSLVERELGLAQRGVELISPVLDMEMGQQAMAAAMLRVGVSLGRTPRETSLALLAGTQAISECTRLTEEAGERLLASIGKDERVLVMVTRNYGISDAVLNAGIPDALIDRGQRVITISHLKAHSFSIEEDYPNIYWPFGQHILAAAKLIRRDPRLVAVYLTNHGCGPDSMLAHLFAEEMGSKPYLHIEVDEHFSKVGIITRIEAFLNSLTRYEPNDERSLPLVQMRVEQNETPLEPHIPVALPAFGLPARTLATYLKQRGFEVTPIASDARSLARARTLLAGKEYLSFTAQLGCALVAAEKAAVSKQRMQLLLPSGEGADADGVYDRVIRSKLAASGINQIKIVAPRLERIPERVKDMHGVVAALLAADVASAAGTKHAPAVLDKLSHAGFALSALREAAAQIGQARAEESGVKGTILAVGEWTCVWDDDLNEGALLRLEAQGWRVKRMPATEMLWFLWCDAYQDRERFDWIASLMAEISKLLGKASPFQDDPYQLFGMADTLVGSLAAAHGRYRSAKTALAGELAQGALAMASLYENTDVILGLAEAASAEHMTVPVMRLGFEGTSHGDIDERLAAFTYYL
nr:acyl-CoA dehydratase activase-related protein [Collinsella urealyticum]